MEQDETCIREVLAGSLLSSSTQLGMPLGALIARSLATHISEPLDPAGEMDVAFAIALSRCHGACTPQ
eukprot:15442056-Alexandrium_andersonii.AAC.1